MIGECSEFSRVRLDETLEVCSLCLQCLRTVWQANQQRPRPTSAMLEHVRWEQRAARVWRWGARFAAVGLWERCTVPRAVCWRGVCRLHPR